MIKYGKQNPLRLALPALDKAFGDATLVIPQRGGIWVGSDCWVTYGSPEDLIVMRAKGCGKFQRNVIKALRGKVPFYVIRGGEIK